MKWKDIKIGTLIVVKNKKATHVTGSAYYDQVSRYYRYILILSDVQFHDDKKSRKRHFYFKAAFYDDDEEKVFVDKFRREYMRSFMKICEDNKMKERIQEKCFFEAL